MGLGKIKYKDNNLKIYFELVSNIFRYNPQDGAGGAHPDLFFL